MRQIFLALRTHKQYTNFVHRCPVLRIRPAMSGPAFLVNSSQKPLKDHLQTEKNTDIDH